VSEYQYPHLAITVSMVTVGKNPTAELAAADHLMQQQGGSIAAESIEGEGAHLRFSSAAGGTLVKPGRDEARSSINTDPEWTVSHRTVPARMRPPRMRPPPCVPPPCVSPPCVSPPCVPPQCVESIFRSSGGGAARAPAPARPTAVPCRGISPPQNQRPPDTLLPCPARWSQARRSGLPPRSEGGKHTRGWLDRFTPPVQSRSSMEGRPRTSAPARSFHNP